MTEKEDLRFLNVTDLDTLTSEESDRRNTYWASKSSGERLAEMQRLNIAKWGDRALGPMKKTLTWVQNVGTPDEVSVVIVSGDEETEETE